MERKSNVNGTALLPVYFKKIGLIVMLIALSSAILIKILHLNLLHSQQALLRHFTMNAFILGLFFIAWSKDKVEDEMTVFIRLKAVAWAFSWAVLFVVIKPLIDLIFNDPIAGNSAQQVVISMLLVYLIMYYTQKRGR